MYSVVLMAALTANTAEAPGFFKHSPMGCCGGLWVHSGTYASCMGCWGAGYGCQGSGWGCYGSGGGCYGGGGWGKHHGGHGGRGSCYGGSGGCWGSCTGGYGGYSGYSGGCYGCMGCYGSWYGYGDYMTPGAIAYPGMNPMYQSTMPSSGTTITPGATGTPGTGAPGAGTPGAPGAGTPGAPGAGGGTTPPIIRDGAAKLIIEKPADAKLYVDDRPVKADGARNTFATPILDPTQAYYYMVRVEMLRDGQTVQETRRVIVRAGQTVQETFREPAITTALAPANQ